MPLRVYEFRSRYGTISAKGRSEAEARAEAAERQGAASEDELVCVSHEPYYKPHIPLPPTIGGYRRRKTWS